MTSPPATGISSNARAARVLSEKVASAPGKEGMQIESHLRVNTAISQVRDMKVHCLRQWVFARAHANDVRSRGLPCKWAVVLVL